ncbi:outer membrane protein assembly factor [Maribacter algicola]|uniref:Outer membrane protein assembly factor n=1 Tax=Meishania litoralis TaxID=3434685 RepID=A0ACC7LIE1_9FLAO
MFRTFLSYLLFLITCFCTAQQSIVDDLGFAGAERTRSDFLQRLVETKTGMVLDSVLLQKDMERLKRLPAVAHAYFEVFPAGDGKNRVVYHIEENFTLIPFANVYTSSNGEFAFRVGLQEFNFLGRNITLGAFYQYDVFNSFGAQIRAPYLFSNKLGLELNFKDLTTREPVFFDDATADYRYNNKGFELMGLYEMNFKNRFELGVSLFNEDYAYLDGAISPNVPQELNVDKHLFKLIYQYDNVKYHYQYLDGFRSSLNLQYVGSQNENLPEFVIGFNDFIWFERIGQRGNWANRLRLGLASNMKTPFAPFTVDNNINIRGVGNTIDRGTGAIVLNSEYRHTLIDDNWFVLQGNVFVDAGSWRNPGGDFGDFGDDDNIRVYPGLGLRFIHKKIFNAIFRVDYGYGITKNASHGIVFGIGQYF